MVLEINIGGGGFQDILAAGGSFETGGYNSTLSTGFSNPLPGRPAWSGNSGGFIDTIVNLPASANGQSVIFKWRFGSDSSVAATGAYIDDIAVYGSYVCSTVGPSTSSARADFDGDGKTDVSVFRPSEGNWYLNRSTDGFVAYNFGISTDVLTPADYDGDGKADTSVFRGTADGSQPDFYILNSGGFTVTGYSWGSPGDIPVVGDFDGNGKADAAVWRESDTTWYVLLDGGGNMIIPFGSAGDKPVSGDFDGDGKADMALFRASDTTWYIRKSSDSSVTSVLFGAATDKLVPGDYDGDGKTDVATYRPSDGNWYILRSSDAGTTIVQFGISTDVPAPGDYDGDGKEDQAIYRNGTWWINGSTAGVSVVSFGLSTDKPIPTAATRP